MSLPLVKIGKIRTTKEYKGKLAVFLLALTLLFVCLLNLLEEAYAQTSLPKPKSYQFTNGQWFDGKSFRRQTFYSVNGFLSRKKPARVDEVVDLENSYIIPPFAEAHSHKLDTQSELDGQKRQFIKEGTMYVMVLNNYASNAVVNRQVFNKPDTLDVLYANGGVTRTGQHPAFAYERGASGIAEWWLPENTKIIQASRKAERDAYWFFDTVEDVDKNWNAYIASTWIKRAARPRPLRRSLLIYKVPA